MNPIVVEFDIAAAPDHAFEVWTRRCALWWPRSHTMGSSMLDVVFEPGEGGRIFERDADGAEHEWGAVTTWEPPTRLEYLWHIFLPRDQATMVTVTFSPTEAGTKVRLENSGFELFGDGAGDRAERVGSAWIVITDQFRGVV